MTGDQPHGAAELLRALRAEARDLVESLPGPLRRLAVRSAGHHVEIEWSDPEVVRPEPAVVTSAAAVVPGAVMPGSAVAGSAVAGSAVAGSAVAGSAVLDDGEGVVTVRAPLVGTFYAAPQPGAAPFVAVGDGVTPGQPVAIIEAMKLMNHIEAETAGTVREILVADGEPVEFDQPLMRLGDPAGGEAA